MLAQRADAHAREFSAEGVSPLSPPPVDVTLGFKRAREAAHLTALAPAAGKATAHPASDHVSSNRDGIGYDEEVPRLALVECPEDGETKKRRKNDMLNPRNFARNPFSSIPQMVSKGALSLQNDAMTLGEEALLGENEVVLHVQWQHRSRTTKVLQYAVLGSQTMAQLADAVYATDRWCLR